MTRMFGQKYLTTTFILKFSVIIGFDLMETKIVIFIFLALFYLSQPPENILVTAYNLEGKYAKQLCAQSH